jgi:hypothetical protein
MPSDDLPPGDRLRRDALVRHGVDSAAAGAVVRAADAVLRLTRRHDVEVAATVDADSGEEPAPVVLGARRSVDVRSHLAALAPGHQYVMLHSHPESDSFSWQDAVWLVARPAVRVLLVVGRDGSWYLLSRDPAGAPVGAQAVRDAVEAEYDRLCPPGDPARRRGMPGRAARRREISHQVWANLARQLGFRYDRLARATGNDVTKRKWSDFEEGMRNIERGVFDDSSLDTMPLGDGEERLPAARRPEVRHPRSASPPRAARRSAQATG